ncbi:MAG: hypothetical protein K9M36_02940 [Candidatus Pacebacteria bacterium]|nr:hypothetical protein [Candidatus Paceibacterota bacterium]
MIIFRILNIRKTIQDTKEIAQNPAGFARDEIKKTIVVYSIVSLVMVIGLLALVFLFGFTDVLGDPSGLARFVFYVLAFIFVCVGFWIFFVVKLLKRFQDIIMPSRDSETIQIKKDVVIEEEI